MATSSTLDEVGAVERRYRVGGSSTDELIFVQFSVVTRHEYLIEQRQVAIVRIGSLLESRVPCGRHHRSYVLEVDSVEAAPIPRDVRARIRLHLALKSERSVACPLLDLHERLGAAYKSWLDYHSNEAVNFWKDSFGYTLVKLITKNVQLQRRFHRCYRVRRLACHCLKMHLFAQLQIEIGISHAIQVIFADVPSLTT